ncbi:ATP-dependent nuclease [Serinicoccus chungangensis]|nr:AAA family ATPase [Serinicoccus chungangensis]
MLKQMTLTNFRAFEKFSVTFGAGAYLVGPNNAGKSTILTALRTIDVLLRYAHARKPEGARQYENRTVFTYPVNLRDFPSLRDSVRHEFGGAEARLEVSWKSTASITVVWPEERPGSDDAPFFFLQRLPGMPVTTVKQARDAFPPLGIIPVLAPIEHSEELLDEKYVRQNVTGRLSSRHFRNQLRLMKEDGSLGAFLDWAAPWMTDVSIESLEEGMNGGRYELHLFCREEESRVPKELVWAGDGIQIWLQLLYHIYRVRESSTIVLDEPEVYLHPDLQRRLVGLLESTGRQVVLATHSSEVVAEADARHIFLVDKSRRAARRPKREADLEILSQMLGTAFNVRLARALRSRGAIFVEGQDMTLLRRFAQTLGLLNIAHERNLTVIPLKGYTHWGQVDAFSWLAQEMLPDALRIGVVLDRDYRTDETVSDVLASLEDKEIVAHVWRRKEIESYVVTPSVISRKSGAPLEDVESWLDEITDGMREDVHSRQLDEHIRTEKGPKNHQVSVIGKFLPIFDEKWKDPAYRRAFAPPKQILSQLNAKLQEGEYKTVSSVGLARAHRIGEIDAEVRDLLGVFDAWA